jgi:hypothetical protein
MALNPLIEELRRAKLEFGRPAVPTVFAEREAFIATGRYPYNADVEAAIIAKYDVPTGLHRQLAREVYLASGQRRVAEMVAQEREGLAEGYRPITELAPIEGARVELRGQSDGPFRLKPDGRGGWLLLPRGKRTNGYRLGWLVAAHEAFALAKQENQTRMNGPSVVMFRPAG